MLYVSRVGFLILLAGSAIGTFATIRQRPRPTQLELTIIAAVAVLGVFALVPPLVGIDTLLPGRWFAFLYAGMALLIATGLAQLSGRNANRRVLLACLIVTICVFPLAGVVSTVATPDAPVLDEEQPALTFTHTEETAADTLREITTSDESTPIYTDSVYTMGLTRPDPGDDRYYTAVVDDDGEAEPHERTIEREYQSTGAPEFVDPDSEDGEERVEQIDRGVLCSAEHSIAYDNGDVRYCTSES
jgi:hypothetical protein